MLRKQINAFALVMIASLFLALAAHADVPSVQAKAVGHSSEATILVYGSAKDASTQSALSFLASYANKLTAVGMDVTVNLNGLNPADKSFSSKAKSKGWDKLDLNVSNDAAQQKNLAAVGMASKKVSDPQIYVVNAQGDIEYFKTGKLKSTDQTALIKAALKACDGPDMDLRITQKALAKGKTYTFKPILAPKFSTKFVTYETSDSSVVRVAQSGKIKGVGYGTATVTARIGNTVETCEVTVSGPLSKIYLNETSATLNEGDQLDLRIERLHPFNASVNLESATWTSSKPSVARVENGRVTAISVGSAKITCKLNKKTVSCTVKVRGTLNTNASYEEQILFYINERRVMNGSKPLTNYEPLAKSARVRAEELSKSFSHTRPNGKSCFTAINFSMRYGAENIAMGFTSAEAVVDGWWNSPPHKKSLLNNIYKESGIGIYQKNGKYYFVQMFATRP
ncbi:Ig-like domain-containing protein [Eubacteriales bacterium OttesenSCG-928-N13]|nr:Ig-like domain-containing protein [Eubacteriales bacterium OttesenSCG-928-N13]